MKIKKIISSLFLASMALFSFNACSDVPAPYDIPGTGDNSSIYGEGTMQNPYSVKGAMLNQNGKLGWVKAYIVGYIPSGGDVSSTISDVVFGADGAGETNMVVSVSPDDKNINNCLAVQLPAGEIRDSLNLKGHPQNLYQEVMLLGTMEKYFGGSGIKNVQAYVMNGDTIGDIPAEEVKAIFSETFASGQGEFTIDNVEVPNEMPEVWTWQSSYKCMVATSFSTSGYINYPSESWLISPEIDLTKAENATLSFERVLYKVNNITIWVKESGSENWNELDMPNKEVTTSWTFQKSGDINLNNYKGKKIQIAFKYLATDQAGTFELKNFTIEDRAAGETPEEPETPTENESSKENPFTVATAISKYNASKPLADTWVKGYIVGYVSDKTIDSSVLNDLSGITDNNKTNLLIADSKTETDYKNCLVLQLPSGDVRNGLNLKDNPSNLGKEVIVKGSLEKYFGTYGLKSITEYVLDGQSSGGTEEGEKTTFTKISEISEGTYVFAALSDGVYKIAQNIETSKTYGYLYVNDVTSDGNTISTVSKGLTFTIKSTADGYTIQDESARFLIMTGTYNSFNLTENPTEGQYWDITGNADGTFTIKNKATNKWIQYSKDYTSFGSYSDSRGVNPILFKK